MAHPVINDSSVVGSKRSGLRLCYFFKKPMRRVFVLATLLVVIQSTGQASDVDFVREVRPILQKHCYACHGATKQKSGLRLDIKSAAFQGGDEYGPSLVAGKASESPLIQLVSSDEPDSRMPPEGAPLSAVEIRTLTQVDRGRRHLAGWN